MSGEKNMKRFLEKRKNETIFNIRWCKLYETRTRTVVGLISATVLFDVCSVSNCYNVLVIVDIRIRDVGNAYKGLSC